MEDILSPFAQRAIIADINQIMRSLYEVATHHCNYILLTKRGERLPFDNWIPNLIL